MRPRPSGWAWPIRFRRLLGLYAFFYACLHLATYLALDLGGYWTQLFADIAKRNMAMFEEAGRAFTAPAKAKPADKAGKADTASEVDKLRAELAALQAKVDKLGK